MDIATAAAVFIAGTSAGALGMAFRNTLIAGNREESPNACNAPCIIANLKDEVAEVERDNDEWRQTVKELRAQNAALLNECRQLHGMLSDCDQQSAEKPE